MITKPYQDVIDKITGLKTDLPDIVQKAVADAEASKDQDATDGLAGISAAADDLASSIRAAATAATATSTLAGGSANDSINASAGADSIDPGAGADSVFGGQGDTTLYPAA